MTKLTQKNLRNGIKRGMTVADFCEKFQLNETELEEEIGRLYVYGDKPTKKIMRQLKENEKKPRKEKGARVTDKEGNEPEIELNTTPKKEELVQSLQSELEEAEVDEVGLVELRKAEEELSSDLVNLESKHAELITEHTAERNRLVEIRDSVKELLKTLKEKRSKFEEVKKDYVDVAKRMREIDDEMYEKEVALEETRAKIEELETVTFYVYESGEITVDSNDEIILDESGSEEIFQSLLQMDICDTLRRREIKVLARLKACVQNAKIEKTVIISDVPEIERVFNLVSK